MSDQRPGASSSQGQPTDERRQDRRLRVLWHGKAFVRLPDGLYEYPLCIHDISIGGIGFRTQACLQVGDSLNISAYGTIPRRDRGELLNFRALVEICYCHLSRHEYVYGGRIRKTNTDLGFLNTLPFL